jgi:hypothetical protein
VISYQRFDNNHLAYQFIDWILVFINIVILVQAIYFYVVNDREMMTPVNAFMKRWYQYIHSKVIIKNKWSGHIEKVDESNDECIAQVNENVFEVISISENSCDRETSSQVIGLASSTNLSLIENSSKSIEDRDISKLLTTDLANFWTMLEKSFTNMETPSAEIFMIQDLIYQRLQRAQVHPKNIVYYISPQQSKQKHEQLSVISESSLSRVFIDEKNQDRIFVKLTLEDFHLIRLHQHVFHLMVMMMMMMTLFDLLTLLPVQTLRNLS